VRGGPAVDRGALVSAIRRIVDAACWLGDVLTSLEINPLLAGPSGAEALDALLELRVGAHPMGGGTMEAAS
jgi:hypothetical protein